MQLIHIEPQTSGEAGGITSSLCCDIAACSKPDEGEASESLKKLLVTSPQRL